MEQERTKFVDEELKVVTPAYMREILGEITQLARRSPEISQRSGVSVRVSIALLKKRALLVPNGARIGCTCG